MSDTRFIINPDDLCQMFEYENINEGKSLEYLFNLGKVSGLCETLATSQQKGICTDKEELEEREKKFGNNHPFVQERTSIWEIIWEGFQETIIQILIGGAIISLIFGTIQDQDTGWLEGVAIFLAVIIVISVTATNDYMKDGQFIKLNKQTNLLNVVVIRNGSEIEIPSINLLVGDVMYISPGEILIVDGLLLRGTGLSIDESAITGESALAKRNILRAGDDTANPFLVSGGKIIEGNGYMLVCTVGSRSVMERHRKLAGIVEEEETPLQSRLGVIATALGKIGLLAGIILVIALLIHVAIDSISEDQWDSDDTTFVINAFILGITVLVVAIPEGLPLALTLAMAYSVLRMKDEHIFVRHLRGCEIMGAATNILSDKTGTLTQNKMKITKMHMFGRHFDNPEAADLKKYQKKIIAENIARNSTAFITKLAGNKFEIIGNRTEGAMLQLIESWEYNYSSFRDLDLQKYQFAFNSASKTMTTVYDNESGGFAIYCKGAAEKVLGFCKYYLDCSGEKQNLTAEKIQEFNDINIRLSGEKLRVLGLAYRLANMQTIKEPTQEVIDQELIFIGLVGIEDPIRPEARNCVIKVQEAGVIVRMVTGDNMETAISIAKQSNILPYSLSPEDIQDYAMKGKHFNEAVGGLITLKDENDKIQGFRVGNIEEFKVVIRKLRVIARCSPEDKLLLVVGLKEIGEVVGVTGDGSNDAAALKQSDIGLAMMSGTKLAKESSDIILLDDNFESVLNSVKWGRNVYASTRKFLQFQITVNIVALAVSILGGISVERSPLSALQMLWVNLIMDSLAALALATEPPTNDLFDTKPFGRNENIINFDMYFTIISQSLYQITMLLILLFLGAYILDIEEGWGHDEWTEENGKHFTIFFHSFVMLQLFNEINCRKLTLSDINVFKGFFLNWMFVSIIIGTFIVQVIMVQYGGKALKCSPLFLYEHMICIGIGFSGLLFGILSRLCITGFRQKSFVKSSKRENYDLETEELLENNN